MTKVISSHAYQLDTLPGIYNVFHTGLLRRASEDPLPSQERDNWQPPSLITDDGAEEYKVEKIIASRKLYNGQTRLYIKWTGYAKPTWEPLDNFRDTTALEAYKAIHGPIDE